MPVKVSVKQKGRVRPPRLDGGVLQGIGEVMVERQKERWSKHVNAAGNTAKPLSKRYTFIKKNFLKKQGIIIGAPYRDVKLTGLLIENFQLRKAINGVIRAENTTKKARDHANGMQGQEEMIGFSGPEQMAAFRNFQAFYGQWVKRAWFQLNA